MTINYTTLKTEINTDPLNVGYAAYVTMGSDYNIAMLLNAGAGSGASTLTLQTMPKDAFQLAVVPAVIALASASSALQAKWDRILGMVEASTVIDFTNSTVQALLAELVTDNLMTQNQVTAINQRTGSRAEVLFGATTIIDHLDVAKALNPR